MIELIISLRRAPRPSTIRVEGYRLEAIPGWAVFHLPDGIDEWLPSREIRSIRVPRPKEEESGSEM